MREAQSSSHRVQSSSRKQQNPSPREEKKGCLFLPIVSFILFTHLFVPHPQG
jgi:hypothetical protein